jgi:GNAT superfamily N-acetyltransferase
MEIEYFTGMLRRSDIVELYSELGWYGLSGYTDDEIEKAEKNSFYSVYAYDGRKLVGLGRIASDGKTVAIMSGICVHSDYRRRGIGEGIVTRLVYFCQSGENAITVQLFCEDKLKRWYEKFGFESYTHGMRKVAPNSENLDGIMSEFHEIYGLDQIVDLIPDFYWHSFRSFGEFRFYGGMNSQGECVPNLLMTYYTAGPVHLSCDLIFDNVQGFEVSCKGLRTPITDFSIVKISNEPRRFRVNSYDKDGIYFFCENFKVINVRQIDDIS